ncbi:HAD family hydrolase [Kineosporia succinea]|uniref:HAD superfamily hydrolase (TIGR01509 family) n=1 Tax=Kineosporia succinea TaxID=84632 RepID=A0ABT9P842_9ACTN|nr:HAD family hydrolase [Kineosporia succinea]MDP9828721.1 HAD superfamily hydrolase (TIGR01509 family) [Kineosporia succinea]
MTAPLASSTLLAEGLPAAVLWDMDGTLVDTEPYWMAEEHLLVSEFGGEWNDEHAHNLIGNALIDSAHYIQKHGGVTLPADEIIARLTAGVVGRIAVEVPWRPGARELLFELHELGVPCALVTMSYREMAEAIVGTLPGEFFRFLVTGDEVEHGKPHAEPYLKGAALLGLEPAQCVAIEDSLTGVASAEAAGVPLLAVEHLVPVPERETRTVTRSLEGWTAKDLGRLVSR